MTDIGLKYGFLMNTIKMFPIIRKEYINENGIENLTILTIQIILHTQDMKI